MALVPNGLRCVRRREKDRPINILEGAVRSGKTWCLHPKALYSCAYNVGGRKLFTGVSKQSVYNNVLTDLFDLVGPRNYCYNRSTGHFTPSARLAKPISSASGTRAGS